MWSCIVFAVVVDAVGMNAVMDAMVMDAVSRSASKQKGLAASLLPTRRHRDTYMAACSINI